MIHLRFTLHVICSLCVTTPCVCRAASSRHAFMQVHCVKAFGALSDIVQQVCGILSHQLLSSPASDNKAHLRHCRLKFGDPCCTVTGSLSFSNM